MDSVQKTPAKRRKLENGTAQGIQTYDSQDDSGDDIFDDYETLATVPLPTRAPQREVSIDILSSPAAYVTQPTQIVRSVKSGLEGHGVVQSQVQVPASSPIRGSPAASPVAGTAFQLPVVVAQAPSAAVSKPSPVVDISDNDFPTYNGSSDEDCHSTRKADIKPSTFIAAAPRRLVSDGLKKGENRFKEITASSFYNPLNKASMSKCKLSTLSGLVFDGRNHGGKQTTSHIVAPKRSADTMANAYGGPSRPLPKPPRQAGPAKALPALELDIDIDDVEDYQLRSKIKRMRNVLPGKTVKACKMALEQKRFNYDDAMDLLVSEEQDPSQIDLTISDGEDPLAAQSLIPKKAPAKQQVKVKQNIQEKWTASQPFGRNLQPATLSPAAAPSKPRRRLVQGRKQPSSPIPVPHSRPKQQSPVQVFSPAGGLSLDSGESDSGVGSEADHTELEGKVLNFFNTCSSLDLADIATISTETAGVLLSQKPFDSLEDIRQISSEIPTKTSAKKLSRRKPIGDKIVDTCLEMLIGYEAVDKLVKRCEDLSRPLKEDMKRWGVDAFGGATGSELELVSFSRDASPRDSGIGTPSSMNMSDTEDGDIRKADRKRGLFPQPSSMPATIQLKDYQVVGINWLSLLYDRKLSCILADDMGLGKTCQVIAFFAHLLEKGVKGPHLVVVPGSTLENWLREFSVFCPQLHVMPYYASQSERPGIQDQILDSRETVNVVITTYTLARNKDDNRFLRKLKPVVCVYDEGHLLKNSKSLGYDAYMRIPSQFRLLLTGTPLQNNLKELVSLLAFILPSVFKEHSEDLEAIFRHKAKTNDDSHAALLSEQRISRAKSMMTPFVLRRKKHQVLKHLPAKSRRVEYCDLSPSQTELYEKEVAKGRRVVAAKAAGEKTGNETSNIMMALRKASIHPLLFRRLYNEELLAKMSKAIIKEEQYREANMDMIYEDMEVMTDWELNRLCEQFPRTMTPFLLQNNEWMDSGKVTKLTSLLKGYRENGDRVLVFSQFTMVMDILEAVMETEEISFFRLDGSTNMNERQPMIDQFTNDTEITAFLLSTKAGGAGINLAAANKIVIFDSSFNPQEDIQAENRAHRVGQKREVEVVRLVTRNSIEEKIHALGETKLALDDRVAGVVADESDDQKAKKQGAKIVEEMMISDIEGVMEVGKNAR